MTTQSFPPLSLAPTAAPGSPRPRLARFVPFAMALGGTAAFWRALEQPWWKFVLYAPQYPHGLRLEIALTGLAGDVHEIGMLNHYIGMKHLEDAATFERQYAGAGVACVVVLAVAALFWRGRRWSWLSVAAGALLPLGFLADSFFWLYRFGHELDPHAPVRIPGFTPQLFGNGQIGQFMTFAQPALGFWLALLGAGLFAAASVLRQLSGRAQGRRASAG
jgi:copper chaperone NosL